MTISADSITSGPIYEGDPVTVVFSSAEGPVTLSTIGGGITISSQDASSATFTVVDIKALWGQILDYNTDIILTVDDGVTNGTINFQVTPLLSHFAAVISSIGGVYLDDIGIEAGQYGYGFYKTGSGTFDPASGNFAPLEPSDLEYWVKDNTNPTPSERTWYGPNIEQIGVTTMSNVIFNIAKGKDIAFADDVINNTPANSALIVVLLKASQADDALRDYTTLSALLANAGNTEADFTNYARKVITDADGVSIVINNTSNTTALDIPDQIWSSAGGTIDNTLTRLLICYDSDTTGGNDANIVPVYAYDFAATTNGENLEARPDPSGLSTQ